MLIKILIQNKVIVEERLYFIFSKNIKHLSNVNVKAVNGIIVIKALSKFPDQKNGVIGKRKSFLHMISTVDV